QIPVERAKNPKSIAFAQISTHGHFIFDPDGCAFNEKAPLIKLLPNADVLSHHVLSGLLNSSTGLFWLKQVCFNKGAGEDEHRDRFEYAGGKVEQLPIPSGVAAQLNGENHGLAQTLGRLASSCWAQGSELRALAAEKLLEKNGEAYQSWGAGLPGYISPHSSIAPPFTHSDALEKGFRDLQQQRDLLQSQLIALQEEMDWLVYVLYELLPD